MHDGMTSTNDTPKPPRIMRSQTVTLVLLAGAGAAALWLGHVDPSQDEEDVLIYPEADACIAGRIREPDDCRNEYRTARAAYPESAPRYDTAGDCEAHHGLGHCVPGDTVAASATGRFVPVMAGYVIGRRAEQGLTPQPVYDHAPTERSTGHGAASGGHAGYCTGWGGRIVPATGGVSSSARVASSAVRRVAFGGFGNSGRSFSSHGGFGRSGG